MDKLTQRDRRVVVRTLGAVEFAISIVGVATWLITGRFPNAVSILLMIVVAGSAPFILPELWHELKDIRLPPKQSDESSKPHDLESQP